MSDPVLAQNVLVRLDRLERENRRLRLAACASGFFLFAWTACSLVPRVPNTLAAERIVLLAPDGSEKATLELDSKGNPMLSLRNGQSSALLTTNGPSLLLRGQDGKTGAFMGIDSRNTSRMELTSHRLLDGVRLSAHEDGSSGVYVLDVNGRERGALEAFGSGGAGLNFRDGQGRVRGQIGIDPANLPNLILLDPNGARRLGMLLQAEGEPLLELADERGQPRARLATLFDGSPQLEFRREDGGVLAQVP
ncbi:MAG: hypothetical protein HOP15_01230 [Planctomycetes bacterium]|nr:hypothetical protein [Planctomycetota bacterium]